MLPQISQKGLISSRARQDQRLFLEIVQSVDKWLPFSGLLDCYIDIGPISRRDPKQIAFLFVYALLA